MTNVTVVVGGQFGSEGKGAITAHLANELNHRGLVIRVAGPNAGHTAYDREGREWKLRAVPVAAVRSRYCGLHIAAGSEVDLEVLAAELDMLDKAGHSASERLTVHPSATILTNEHIGYEQEVGLINRIGSTGKGIGAARSARVMRRASTFGELTDPRWQNLAGASGPFEIDGADNIVIEGTQGYGLGLHTQYYPQVTSSDCRAIDFLAMAGISPWAENVRLNVVVVVRVNPIRVAGNSGPLQDETSWGDLGLPEERTTVTNKVRRVGGWDRGLVLEALAANGGGDFHPDVKVALTMVDHRFPDVHGQEELTDEANKYVNALEDDLQAYITLVGTGPQTVVER